jgi:hypothetical protein
MCASAAARQRRPERGRRTGPALPFSSGNDIGDEPVLELGDEILEDKLPLLETLDLKLVERRLLGDPRNQFVKVAVLASELLQASFDRFEIEIHLQRESAGFL